ncbi:MAG: hypothetical protein NTW28_05440 [Candidatus Solibacter sp.]|nr:hypothetical protein [Candidatus Solibacter sp.]
MPFADSTTVLAQRFEHAGLTTAWEATFHTAAEPRPPASAVTQTGGQAPAITTVVSQQLLRTVERAERTGRARTLSQARPGHTSRQAPMPAEDRESVPQRPLTPAEAEKLRAATTIAPASSVTPRQWPAPATITHDRGWEAKAEDDAAPRQRWVPPTGTGLRRLASLVGVPPGEPAHEDAALAPRAAGLPDRERTPLHGAPGAGPADFVSCLGEALRAEAIRSGIDPEELIR